MQEVQNNCKNNNVYSVTPCSTSAYLVHAYCKFLNQSTHTEFGMVIVEQKLLLYMLIVPVTKTKHYKHTRKTYNFSQLYSKSKTLNSIKKTSERWKERWQAQAYVIVGNCNYYTSTLVFFSS